MPSTGLPQQPHDQEQNCSTNRVGGGELDYSDVRDLKFRKRKRTLCIIEEQVQVGVLNNVREQSIRKSIAIFIEGLHLRVMSRTLKRWGSDRKYEIYQLPSPTKMFTPQQKDNIMTMDQLADTIQQTFRNVYRSPCEHTGKCRAYCYIKEPTTNTTHDETNKNKTVKSMRKEVLKKYE